MIVVNVNVRSAMPLRKVKGGHKNFSRKGRPLSKKPLSRKRAVKQLRAIKASKAERMGRRRKRRAKK